MNLSTALTQADAAVQDYTVFSFAGDTFILLYCPYQPQTEVDMAVDNYYPAYQRVRRSKLQLQQALEEEYEVREVGYTYKSLALLDEQMMVLHNNLMAHPAYGTYFVMEIMRLAGEWAPPSAVAEELDDALSAGLRAYPCDATAWRTLTALRHSPVCASCGRCTAACPSGALDGDFRADLCVRYWQGKGVQIGSAQGRAVGQRLLGCHTCQDVCPYNAHALHVAPLVDGHALFLAALHGKKALLPFADCLGNNYLRPAKLLCLALNCAANRGDDGYLRYADELLAFPDERVRQAFLSYRAIVQA